MTLAVDDAVRDDLADESVTVRMVWLVIQEADRPLTTAEIERATALASSTTRRALQVLRAQGLIRRRRNVSGDARKHVHAVDVSLTSER
ncbi:MarR family transcriptional regulator [Haloferax namakaokahaiae]|uniref:MarR family transcriptional regulator n=1 Tax=Haloferax namakaokahaiae TaxID=1748331 RepID=A0ABD5ZCK1_9EURY